MEHSVIDYDRPILTMLAVCVSSQLAICADDSRGGRVYLERCLYVCLFVCFPHDVSNTAAARSTKLDVEMFHDDSRKLIYLRVKRSKGEVTRHKKRTSFGFCTLVSADFF